MKFRETNIKGCYEIEPEVFEDERGGFFRVFCENEFNNVIGKTNFTQINHSINNTKGTFRGMHYQANPYSEGKLIRCISGKVIDYFLDLRSDSPTFMKHGYLELSAKSKNMIYICKGIAHGFYTLEDDSELIYHHTENYNPKADRGIRFDDPKITLDLPGSINSISEKDLAYPLLTEAFKGIKI